MNQPVDNPLQLPGIHALVAGNGGIGAAMVEQLLARYPIERLYCLRRNKTDVSADARVTHLPFDAGEPESLAAVAERVAGDSGRLHLVINTVGMLHADGVQPERRLRDVTLPQLERLMAVNGYFIALLAGALAPLLRHDEPALLASLSARVGSIDDNRLGGWHSYRASKAAHNMLLRNLAHEWRVSHRNACVLALHPGTVATRLSAPFVGPNYRKRLLTPEESATALLSVMAGATAADSGAFLSWEGETIPW